jgi:hypothetical protein
MAVFVLDARHQHPLMPCAEKRARLLLQRQRADVLASLIKTAGVHVDRVAVRRSGRVRVGHRRRQHRAVVPPGAAGRWLYLGLAH